MTKRRSFLKATMAVTAGAAVGNSAIASAGKKEKFSGVIYSKENPGKWDNKVNSHAPKVSVEGKQVTIKTLHGMSEEHFIVRHTLVCEHGKVLGEKTFYPTVKKAESTFTLPDKHAKKFYATSFCNKHDLWVTEFTVE
jgi:superoxide reductase